MFANTSRIDFRVDAQFIRLPYLFRYCGVFTGIRQLEMRTAKRFTFHSNGQNSDLGYSIYVKQVECDRFPTTTTSRPLPTVPGRSTPTVTQSTYRPPIRTTTAFPNNPFTTTRRPPFSTYAPPVITPTNRPFITTPRTKYVCTIA